MLIDPNIIQNHMVFFCYGIILIREFQCSRWRSHPYACCSRRIPNQSSSHNSCATFAKMENLTNRSNGRKSHLRAPELPVSQSQNPQPSVRNGGHHKATKPIRTHQYQRRHSSPSELLIRSRFKLPSYRVLGNRAEAWERDRRFPRHLRSRSRCAGANIIPTSMTYSAILI